MSDSNTRLGLLLAAFLTLGLVSCDSGVTDRAGSETSSTSKSQTSRVEQDPVKAHIEEMRAEGIIRTDEVAERRKNGWYFDNPVEYNKYEMPSDKFVFGLEMVESDRKKAQNANTHQNWFGELSTHSREAKLSFWSIARIDTALVGCGHERIGDTDTKVSNHLLPFKLNRGEIDVANQYLKEFGLGGHSPSFFADNQSLCMSYFEFEKPTREQAFQFARYQAVDPFLEGAGFFQNLSPELERSFNDFKDKLREVPRMNIVKRTKMLRNWFNEEGIRTDEVFFDKLISSLEERYGSDQSGSEE